MSDNIIEIYRNAYTKGFLLEAQQTKSYLEQAVLVEKVEGEKWFKDRILSDTTTSGINTISSRHEDTAFNEYDFQRRMITPVQYTYSVLVDKIDQLKTVEDPKSELIQEGIRRLNRKKDSLIIAAATGTAYTGATGTTSTAFDSNMVVASGTTGMTKDKLVATSKLFYENDVDPSVKRYMVIGPEEYADMYSITEFVTADSNNTKPMVDGGVTYFMGFNFILSNLLVKSGSVRDCIAFTANGLCLGVGENINTRLEEYQAKNYNWHIFASCFLGATRLAEEQVVKIQCIE